jgi:hypothetical protein
MFGNPWLRRMIAVHLMKGCDFLWRTNWRACRSLSDGVPDPIVELGLHIFLAYPYNTDESNR